MPYLVIIVVVLITSPFILKLVQSQKKEDKRRQKFAEKISFLKMMRYLILLILIIGVVGGIYYSSQKTTSITQQQALEKVRTLPEVQDYLNRIPNGIVEVDNELEGEYNVHVYEIKDGHTATFNWYRVSIKSGEIRSEFEIPNNRF